MITLNLSWLQVFANGVSKYFGANVVLLIPRKGLATLQPFLNIGEGIHIPANCLEPHFYCKSCFGIRKPYNHK